MKAECCYKPKLYLRKLGQVWQVYKEGKSVFHGTKKQCEEWMANE